MYSMCFFFRFEIEGMGRGETRRGSVMVRVESGRAEKKVRRINKEKRKEKRGER